MMRFSYSIELPFLTDHLIFFDLIFDDIEINVWPNLGKFDIGCYFTDNKQRDDFYYFVKYGDERFAVSREVIGLAKTYRKLFFEYFRVIWN